MQFLLFLSTILSLLSAPIFVKSYSVQDNRQCVLADFAWKPSISGDDVWSIFSTTTTKITPMTTRRFYAQIMRFNFTSNRHDDGGDDIVTTRRRRPERSVTDDKPVSRNIINGEPADPKQWPFLVTIFRRGRTLEFDGEHWDIACGGTLIHPLFVLTAAHCFIRKTLFGWNYIKEDNFAVRIGDYSLLVPNISTAVTTRVADYIPHPKFNFGAVSRGNDIAVVKLAKPVIVNDYAQPACLPKQSSPMPVANQPCQSAGRGAVVRDGSRISSFPREATLWVTDNETCFDNLLVPDFARDGRLFCASDPKGLADTCSGDSGGPIFCLNPRDNTWMLSGIVSFGVRGCGETQSPGAYTSISYYTDWANEAMTTLLLEKTTTTLRPPLDVDKSGDQQASNRTSSGGSLIISSSSSDPLNNLLRDALLRLIIEAASKNDKNGTTANRFNRTTSENDDDGGRLMIVRINRTIIFSGHGTTTNRIIPGGGQDDDFEFILP